MPAVDQDPRPTASPASRTAPGYPDGNVGGLAVVTGASGGIGAATARALAASGFEVVCTARRTDRIEGLAAEIGGRAVTCDVTDPASVAALAAEVGPELRVLVNNAGGALGADSVEEADPEQWRTMYDVNVLGLLHVTQALLPALRASGDGVIVNVGSTAGRTAYEGGGGYTAAKHGTKVVTETLRLELVGEPIRICEVAPGMVHTEEFAKVRFGGDQARADAVYAGVPDPLVAEDVADAIAWMATRPAHMNVDELVLRPRAQAAQHKVHRVGQ
jgi:NADP-dependent 3-hydroxy acid dehydrogenase YdfG